MSNYGSIKVDSVPEASVFINDEFMNTTPLDINDINPGNYTYILKCEGYDNQKGNLIVIKDKIIRITMDFTSNIKNIEYIDPNLKYYNQDDITNSNYKFIDEKIPEHIDISDIPPTPPIIDTSTDLNEIKNLLQKLVDNSTKQIEKTSFSKFDTGIQTLSNTVTTIPDIDNVSSTGYTRIAVWDVLERLSQNLYLINQGAGTIFVRKSNDGKTFSASEIPVFAGEKGTFNDVYELRIRSDITSTRYRVTEYESSLYV